MVTPPRNWLRTVSAYVKELRKYSSKLAIAGSIRRKVPDPNDVDIVLIPKNKQGIYDFVKRSGKILAIGPSKISTKLKNGIKIQIFFSNRNDWGAQLLRRTGGKKYNIALSSIAQKKGMTLNEYGLFKNGKK